MHSPRQYDVTMGRQASTIDSIHPTSRYLARCLAVQQHLERNYPIKRMSLGCESKKWLLLPLCNLLVASHGLHRLRGPLGVLQFDHIAVK